MDENPHAHDFDSDAGDGSVRTNSPLKKMWLTTFRGYRVSSVSRAPKAGMFGQISYTKTWKLKQIK
jgi:hypothetical protein